MSISDIVGKAYDIGIQPWAVEHDGSKRPRGAGWGADDLDGRLTREETLEQFRPDDTGYGFITGKPSRGLALLELEGRFVAEYGWDDFISACADAGVDDILERVRQGCEGRSPSGGVHLPFFVDGESLPNRRLASRPEEKTSLPLIETREERGFMVAPGSNGAVHPTGGKWELVRGKLSTIATLSAEERDLLYAVAATFDEMPERRPPAAVVPPGAGLGPESFRDGVDDLQRFVVEVLGVESLLVEDGWRHLYTKRDGEQIWQRAGKDRGPSASLFPDGGFNCYTTTIGEAWYKVLLDGAFPHATPLGVLAAVRFDGDVAMAMSHVRKRIRDVNEAPPPATDTEGHEIDSYAPVDLRAWLAGDVVSIEPDGLMITDTRGLIYLNRVNGIHGDSGAGKSFAAAFLIREQAEAGNNIMLIDLEDNPAPLLQRLRQFDVSDELIAKHLTFVHPQEEFSRPNVELLVEIIRERDIGHVIIDSLGEAFGTEGIDENADVEVTEWIRRVVRRIVDATGAGVTLIDHVTKTADNPLHPSGSKRKRAALTGASWYALATKPFTKDAGGRMVFRCGKDRHGNYRQGDIAAELVMELDPLLGYVLRLEATTVDNDVEGGNAKPKQFDTVITFMRNQRRSVSVSGWLADLKRNGINMSSNTLKGIVDLGVLFGELKEEAGPRGSRIITATDLDPL